MKTQRILRTLAWILLDTVLCCGAYLLAVWLRFEGETAVQLTDFFLVLMPLAVSMYLLVFVLGRVYSVIWRHAGLREIAMFAPLSAIATFLYYALTWGTGLTMSRAVILAMGILSMLFCAFSRIVARLMRKSNHLLGWFRFTSQPKESLLIVGAGAGGRYVLRSFLRDGRYTPGRILLVDDDPTKLRHRLAGVPVRGQIQDIPALVEAHPVREIVIAIPSMEPDRLREVALLCTETGCPVRILRDPTALAAGAMLRSLDTRDFLAREETVLDMEPIRSYLEDRTVLVTGGGGSIGSELCRQIVKFDPARLVVFDIYENDAYALQQEIKRQYGFDLEVLIGSVCDTHALQMLFDSVQPSVVFHAAAHKHVPLMERSPAEAVKNNVFGTRNTLEAAATHGVERFVLLSTDKAVNPTNVMGATKRATEMLIQHYAKTTAMKCMAVRFGNVLGSHGSVIPLFEEQIRAGGPVTVTHPDITRYFMTIPEASRLVLQAGSLAQTGSIYILEMGEPIRILDLAEKLIRFKGLKPGVDIEIRFSGLREGEKLYEELLHDRERDGLIKTSHEKILIAPPEDLSGELLLARLSALDKAVRNGDAAVVTALTAMVSTFAPQEHLAAG